MKARQDEHSLPLVNLTVDTTVLNRYSFVPGEIEIADYWRRTYPSSDSVRYRCLLRIRGMMAASLEKKSFAVKLVDDAGEDLDVPVLASVARTAGSSTPWPRKDTDAQPCVLRRV